MGPTCQPHLSPQPLSPPSPRFSLRRPHPLANGRSAARTPSSSDSTGAGEQALPRPALPAADRAAAPPTPAGDRPRHLRPAVFLLEARARRRRSAWPADRAWASRRSSGLRTPDGAAPMTAELPRATDLGEEIGELNQHRHISASISRAAGQTRGTRACQIRVVLGIIS
jgi:hypothetical protein